MSVIRETIDSYLMVVKIDEVTKHPYEYVGVSEEHVILWYSTSLHIMIDMCILQPLENQNVKNLMKDVSRKHDEDLAINMRRSAPFSSGSWTCFGEDFD